MTKFFEAPAITAAWSRATAAPIESRSARVDAYVTALAKEYANGTVAYAELELSLDQPVLEMAAHHENWKLSQLLDLVWLVPAVAKRLPALGTIRPEPVEHFEAADVFELASVLGRALHFGGAYSSSSRPFPPMLALGSGCAEELMESEGSLAFFAHAAWCAFFQDVAWDFTVVVVAPRQRRVKLLLATDTD